MKIYRKVNNLSRYNRIEVEEGIVKNLLSVNRITSGINAGNYILLFEDGDTYVCEFDDLVPVILQRKP